MFQICFSNTFLYLVSLSLSGFLGANSTHGTIYLVLKWVALLYNLNSKYKKWLYSNDLMWLFLNFFKYVIVEKTI